MYLAILMLTGQGIPDGLLPPATKVGVAITAFFSVAIFAIPAAMLAWGFEAEAERLFQKKKEIRKKKTEAERLGKEYVPSESSDSDDDDDDGKDDDATKSSPTGMEFGPSSPDKAPTIALSSLPPAMNRGKPCPHCAGTGIVDA